MARIVIRLLLCLILAFNLIILALCAITGVNIYKKYGKHILIGIAIFTALITAFYIALALLGIGD